MFLFCHYVQNSDVNRIKPDPCHHAEHMEYCIHVSVSGMNLQCKLAVVVNEN